MSDASAPAEVRAVVGMLLTRRDVEDIARVDVVQPLPTSAVEA